MCPLWMDNSLLPLLNFIHFRPPFGWPLVLSRESSPVGHLSSLSVTQDGQRLKKRQSLGITGCYPGTVPYFWYMQSKLIMVEHYINSACFPSPNPVGSFSSGVHSLRPGVLKHFGARDPFQGKKTSKDPPHIY